MSDQYVDRGRLGAAVREWLAVVEEGGELTRIKVIHEGARDPVREYTRGKGELPRDANGTDADDLVEAIAKKIEGDASGFDGTVEQYFVEAYFGGAHRSSAREPFRVSVEDGGKDNRRGRTEKPTDQGLTALAMRHADQSHEKSLRSFTNLETVLRGVQKMLTESLEREAALRKENFEMWKAIQDNKSLEADIKRKDEAAVEEAKMKREIFEDLKVLAKIIANKASGGTLIPEGELAPEQRLIRQAVKELDGQQVGAMIDVFQEKHPRIAKMLSELVLTVQDEDARRVGIAKVAAERALPVAPPLNGKPASPELGPARGEPLPR